MTNSPSASSSVLLALTELDKTLLHALSRQVSIRDTFSQKAKALAGARAKLAAGESELEWAVAEQSVYEEKIRDEERKIIERRKQLTALGGTKGAKMVERELDLSTRTMQGLEERVLKAMEGVEQRKSVVTAARTALQHLEQDSEESRVALEAELTEIESRLAQIQKSRGEVAGQVESGILRLYERIKARYPSDPAVLATNNTCQGCHRSLPANLYQQVLLLPDDAYRAGAGVGTPPVQCPGCSRILVPDGTGG